MTEPIVPKPSGAPADRVEIQKRRLKEACQEFEATLTNILFQSMRDSLPRAEEPSQERETYESMRDDCIARQLSLHQGNGLGDLFYRELVKNLDHEQASGGEEHHSVAGSSLKPA
jgi:Rod binding domain-containing protein